MKLLKGREPIENIPAFQKILIQCKDLVSDGSNFVICGKLNKKLVLYHLKYDDQYSIIHETVLCDSFQYVYSGEKFKGMKTFENFYDNKYSLETCMDMYIIYISKNVNTVNTSISTRYIIS